MEPNLYRGLASGLPLFYVGRCTSIEHEYIPTAFCGPRVSPIFNARHGAMVGVTGLSSAWNSYVATQRN
jgi:hypothetical protein